MISVQLSFLSCCCSEIPLSSGAHFLHRWSANPLRPERARSRDRKDSDSLSSGGLKNSTVGSTYREERSCKSGKDRISHTGYKRLFSEKKYMWKFMRKCKLNV